MTKTVSSTTLFRKARTETNKTKAAKMRKQASKLRREERAAIRKSATKKARKMAKKRKPRAADKIMAGLKEAVDYAAAQAALDEFRSADATETAEALAERVKIMRAQDEGARMQHQHQNDDIVCSVMAAYGALPHERYQPYVLTAAEMRGLMDVLGRAGYSMHGKRTTAPAGDTMGKAHDVAGAA